MKQSFLRAVAGIMVLLLVTTSVGSMAPAFAKESQKSEPEQTAKQEKVLTVTRDMVAKNGKLTITGEWDRIVVPKEIEASDIYFEEVKVESVEIESGVRSKIEMVSGDVGAVSVLPAKLTQMTVKDFCEMIKQTGDSAAAINEYLEVQTQNKKFLNYRPTLITRKDVTIAEVNVSGNVKLDFGKGNVDAVKVDADGSQRELAVDISNFNGKVSVKQKDREDGEWMIARVKFKNAKVENLVMEGEGQGNIILSGQKSEVKEVTVENAPFVTLNVQAEKVEIGKSAVNVKITVLAKVEEMKVEADNARVEVGNSGTVESARVEGNNVNISGNGTLTDVEIKGKGASVSTPGTKVEGENTYVPPVVVVTPTPEPVVPPTEEVRDLGGLQIIIGDWYSPETPSEPTTPEEIARQKYREEMMEKYNFTIKQVKVASWGEMVDTYQTSIALGNPVAQVFLLDQRFLGGGRELFYDLSTLSEFDFGEDKWNDAVREQMTYGNGIYGMSAEKSKVRGGVFFNKRLFKEAGLDPELPYDLQKSGEWTWSKFKEICEKLTRDTDGDGKTDIYATGSQGSSTLKQLILSTGTELIAYENGKYVNNLGSEKVKTAIDFANELVDAGYEMPQPEYSSWNWFEPAFAGGLVAMQFNEEYMAQPQYAYDQMEDEIGFVCCPKPDGADTYHGYFYDSVAVIPACYDAQTAADIAFAYNLWTNSVPGYEESEDSWKKYYQAHNIDERAINETMEIIFEEGVSAGLHSYLLEEEKDGALTGGLYWSWPFVNETTEEVIARLMPVWDAAVAKANGEIPPEIEVTPKPELTITEAGWHDSFYTEYPDPENPDATCVIDFGKGISGKFTYSRELTQEELENWWHGGELYDVDGKQLDCGGDFRCWSYPSGVFAVQLPQDLKAGTYSYVLYQTINGQYVSDSYTFTVDEDIPPANDTGLLYAETEAGTLCITGYTDTLPANSVIPGIIDGKTVTAVSGGAFANCGTLVSVTIPESVTTIGENAFENCVNLTIVTTQGSYADTYAREHGISVRYVGLEKLTLTITEAGWHDSFHKEYPDPENPDATCVIDFGKGISGKFTYSRELTQEELENWWHGGELYDADGQQPDCGGDFIRWSDSSGVFAVQLPQDLKAGTYSYVLHQTINGQNVSDSYTFIVD